MNVHSLCNDIEQFLQQTDQNSKNQFLNWLKSRFHVSTDRKNECLPLEKIEKSVINTSQLFVCQCGHRYSLRLAMTDDCHEQPTHSTRFYLCTKCQIHLHTREIFLKHYSMHQRGYLFCKSCSQFYNNEQMKFHDCQQQKIDELQSLEQLIPPDTNEQEHDSNPIDLMNNQDTSNSTRIAHLGLPKLTDSITEIRQPDGKRQFRCPICSNSYVNRSGLNRHYITHSSQDLWKVECQYCGKRYSRKDSLKHHIKTQHAHMILSDKTFYQHSNEKLFQSYLKLSSNSFDIDSKLSNEKDQIEHDDVVLIN
ncbi:hypothetical protein I4U23_014630 [Adineta vaga]|nr:hypothetical protein I4U23_014630 [Adineta vaga]